MPGPRSWVAAGTVDGTRHTQAVDGFIRNVGNGITGLVGGAFDFIGDSLRGMVGAANDALPGGMLLVVVFVILVFAAWQLAKR